jgi:hypothetical protein
MNEKTMEILQCSKFKHDYITTEEVDTTVMSYQMAKHMESMELVMYEMKHEQPICI